MCALQWVGPRAPLAAGVQLLERLWASRPAGRACVCTLGVGRTVVVVVVAVVAVVVVIVVVIVVVPRVDCVPRGGSSSSGRAYASGWSRQNFFRAGLLSQGIL